MAWVEQKVGGVTMEGWSVYLVMEEGVMREEWGVYVMEEGWGVMEEDVMEEDVGVMEEGWGVREEDEWRGVVSFETW